ncbi:unnamed protein product [Discosporangium mesarthrocarpum]
MPSSLLYCCTATVCGLIMSATLDGCAICSEVLCCLPKSLWFSGLSPGVYSAEFWKLTPFLPAVGAVDEHHPEKLPSRPPTHGHVSLTFQEALFSQMFIGVEAVSTKACHLPSSTQ